jgi:hypothetical protein
MPEHADDDVDLPYKMAKLLTDKGVLVGLENSGAMERMNTRNLPFSSWYMLPTASTKSRPYN